MYRFDHYEATKAEKKNVVEGKGGNGSTWRDPRT